jgi:DNA-binding transcriptional regulator GbsR (MarR family)
MSRDIKYNSNSNESERLLCELNLVYDEIKTGLHKKYFSVYEDLLNRLHQITLFHVNIFNKHLHELNLNDSDNEETYDDEIKNLNIEDTEVDSISEYETDVETDDEDYIKTFELINLHEDYCKNKFEQFKEDFLLELE